MTAKLLSRRMLSIAVAAVVLGGGALVAKTYLVTAALAACPV
jgi:hypothetical protein